MTTFYVNGQQVQTNEKKKLLRFLRDDMHLTSVKDGVVRVPVVHVLY